MDLLAALKAGTAEAHGRIETAASPLSADFGRDALVAYLSKLHAFHADLEPRLEGALAAHASRLKLPERLRADLLADDLFALTGARADAAPLPGPHRVDVPDPARALGALYVLEGSTLGGQLLSRSFAERLSVPPLSYFSSRGDRLGPMWRDFKAALTELLPGEADGARAVAAARETFSALDGWLRA